MPNTELLLKFLCVSTFASWTWFGNDMWLVRHTCKYGTSLWSMGDYITSSRLVWINTVLCLCYTTLFCNIVVAALINASQQCSQPKNLGGGQNVWFWANNAILLYCLSTHKMTISSQNFGGMASQALLAMPMVPHNLDLSMTDIHSPGVHLGESVWLSWQTTLHCRYSALKPIRY